MTSNRSISIKSSFQLKLFLVAAATIVALVTTTAKATEGFDYEIWSEILQRFVDDRGNVNYQALLENREHFDQYIQSIETISPEHDPELFTSPAEELAYYINAYNAMVFNGVLARGPEKKSVWRGLISGLNFFVRMDIVIGGEETNLKRLEDKVIRERYKDPRVHAALNCASISCPKLIREPYLAPKLEQQLDRVMTDFLNRSEDVVVDQVNERLGLSKIFDWYDSDFLDYEATQGNTEGDTDSLLIDYINRYRTTERQIPNHYDIYYLDYDKGINNQ